MTNYCPIAHYAIIGCTRSAALISREGSIDWLCWPRFDSPSVFARILDYERGGFFSIRPAEQFKATRRYLPSTNVLETTFECHSGVVKLTDLMPVTREAQKRDRLIPLRHLLRRVECHSGEGLLEVQFSPRMNYGRSSQNLSYRGDSICCEDIPKVLHLRSYIRFDLRGPDAAARFMIKKGDHHDFALSFDEQSPAVLPHLGDCG